jgi:hypothetical protein
MPIPLFVRKIPGLIREHAWWFIIAIEVIGGFILLFSGYLLILHLDFFTSFLWLPQAEWGWLLRAAGVAVLASGVFAATLKAFQFSNVFREELANVLYDAEQLRYRKDIERIWSDASKILYNERFPEISDLIHKTILQTYFPKDVNYYYDSFREEVTYSLVENLSNFLNQRNELKMTIKAHDLAPFTVGISSRQYKSKSDTTDTYYALRQLKINGKDETTKYQKILREKVVSEEKKLISSFDIELSGKRTYDLYIRSEKQFSLEFDNHKELRFSKFVRDLELTVRHPESIVPEFFSLGTAQPFEEGYGDETVLRRSNKCLIFPAQGYTMFLTRR